MAIEYTSLEYTRNPIIPDDPEGRTQYLAVELDKISFILANIQNDIKDILVSLDERISVLEGP